MAELDGPPGDEAEAISALKQESGKDLHMIGRAQLLQTLIGNDLVDELRLMIDPVALGGGKGIFPDEGEFRPLQLIDSQVSSTGATLATYARTES